MAESGVTPMEAAARAAKQTVDAMGIGWIGLGLAEDVARAALTAAIEALPERFEVIDLDQPIESASIREVFEAASSRRPWPVPRYDTPKAALRRALLGDQ